MRLSLNGAGTYWHLKAHVALSLQLICHLQFLSHPQSSTAYHTSRHYPNRLPSSSILQHLCSCSSSACKLVLSVYPIQSYFIFQYPKQISLVPWKFSNFSLPHLRKCYFLQTSQLYIPLLNILKSGISYTILQWFSPTFVIFFPLLFPPHTRPPRRYSFPIPSWPPV